MSAKLASPQMRARLLRFLLRSRQICASHQRGRHATMLAGGTEPVDTRSYSPGDDPRRIVWSAYGRHEKLLTWLMADTTPRPLGIVLDTSASMGFGEPSKLAHSATIAAAFCAIALEKRVGIAVAGGGTLLQGTVTFPAALGFLDGLEPGQDADLLTSCRLVDAALNGVGDCVVLSDFFDAQGPSSSLELLRGRGHRVCAIEVVHPLELDPPDMSGCVACDAETGQELALPTEGAKEAYLAALDEHRVKLRRGCGRLRAPLVTTGPGSPFEEAAFQTLRCGLFADGADR